MSKVIEEQFANKILTEVLAESQVDGPDWDRSEKEEDFYRALHLLSHHHCQLSLPPGHHLQYRQ